LKKKKKIKILQKKKVNMKPPPKELVKQKLNEQFCEEIDDIVIRPKKIYLNANIST
jgi:hypothetical protein